MSTTSSTSSFDDKIPQVMLLDWDDTILPTTWLLSGQHSPSQVLHAMVSLDQVIVRWLRLLETQFNTHVVMVTNAAEEHVQHSLRRYLPHTRAAILARHIPIVSARDLYSGLHPHSTSTWKKLAFHRVLAQLAKMHSLPRHTRVLIFGDGPDEMAAGEGLKKHGMDVVLLKGAPTPSPQVVEEQLDGVILGRKAVTPHGVLARRRHVGRGRAPGLIRVSHTSLGGRV